MTLSVEDIRTQVRDAFRPSPPARLGVAVSGGGDSVALLHILLHCFQDTSVDLRVATVDHGLRPESRAEAHWVADYCESFDIPHSILLWKGWDGSGNLQARARQARYALLTDWAKSYDLSDIALGHTADDQAETLIMRLARSSGVDGLAGMAPRRTQDGITLIRPLLDLGRAELRSYLKATGVNWIEDPSNQDLTYDRIKARQALEVLAPLGISVRALAETARHMDSARAALKWYSFLAAQDCVQIDGGDVIIEHRQLRTLPQETARRILVCALQWIGGSEHPPRSTPMSSFVDAARAGRPGTLAGCQMLHHGPYVWICREYSAVQKEECACSERWDRRWTLTGGATCGLVIRALGRKGMMECPDWRATGRPYASLLSSPAVWDGKDLVAAPMAGHANGWSADAFGSAEDFHARLLAH